MIFYVLCECGKWINELEMNALNEHTEHGTKPPYSLKWIVLPLINKNKNS